MAVAMDDPRVTAYREALADINAGLSAPPGAHQRYQRAIGPYLDCMAEFTPDESQARRAMMVVLYQEAHLPLGAVAAAFRATEDEVGYLMDQPTLIDEEPVDEQERLARMPYGQYLRTPHWQRVRRLALDYYEHRCALCGSPHDLEVHHRDDRAYRRRGAERPSDVIVLCAQHHAAYHGTTRRRTA